MNALTMLELELKPSTTPIFDHADVRPDLMTLDII